MELHSDASSGESEEPENYIGRFMELEFDSKGILNIIPQHVLMSLGTGGYDNLGKIELARSRYTSMRRILQQDMHDEKLDSVDKAVYCRKFENEMHTLLIKESLMVPLVPQDRYEFIPCWLNRIYSVREWMAEFYGLPETASRGFDGESLLKKVVLHVFDPNSKFMQPRNSPDFRDTVHFMVSYSMKKSQRFDDLCRMDDIENSLEFIAFFGADGNWSETEYENPRFFGNLSFTPFARAYRAHYNHVLYGHPEEQEESPKSRTLTTPKMKSPEEFTYQFEQSEGIIELEDHEFSPYFSDGDYL